MGFLYMKVKHVLAISALLLLAPFLLSGCGADSPAATTASSDNPGTSEPETIGEVYTSEYQFSRSSVSTPGTTDASEPSTDIPETNGSTTGGTTGTPAAGDKTLRVPPPSADTKGYTDAQLFAFYDDAVFIGDSISLGWRNYVTSKRSSSAGFMGKAQFLVSGSLGAANSLWDINTDPNDGIENSVHPLYNGKQMQLWNSIPLTGAKKIFIMFGLNDVGLYGVDATVSNYGKLLDKIKANVPDAKFYIISATYVVKGGARGDLTSENLRKLNIALIDFCSANGYSFINIADALADSDGNLKAAYCSDGFVHQTTAAYDVWTSLLKGFAASQLSN